MAQNLQGTETAKNLMKAFAGESQARNKYTYYGKQAEKEGYVQIAKIFWETADNEREHAKRFFNLLNKDLKGKGVLIEADYPVGIGTTQENLNFAAEGEHDEHSKLYPHFGDVAEKEGFLDVAKAFREVAKVEEHHEQRYRKLLENIKNDTVFKKDVEVAWICNNCGNIHHGKEAPENCIVCFYPKGYFQVHVENY